MNLPVVLASVAVLVPLAGGCGGDCCTLDSFPILLDRAPLGGPAPGGGGTTNSGGLLARAQADGVAGGEPFTMVVDTGAPITVFDGPFAGTSIGRAFTLHDATATSPGPLRARFRDIATVQLPLGTLGDATTKPLAVLGGNLLHSFSIELRLGRTSCAQTPVVAGATCPSLTFWSHQAASDGILQDAGFAIIKFSAYGGGEVNVQGNRDFLGLRGPLSLAPSRIVLRSCAAPLPFDPITAPPTSCPRGQEGRPESGTSGVNLSLLLATGVGPLVLSQSAWGRVAATLPAPPALARAPLLVATWPAPIEADWTTISRMALVNLEAGVNDPGACVELGRARRLEWVAHQQAKVPQPNICAQPCDSDPREPEKAYNSAAYIELGGDIPVAVIADSEPLLQGLRADVRPEGPELDGLLGAAALGPARFEIDYRSSRNRVVFSCDGADVPRETCRTAARCPRLPDRQQKHLCFGLPAHGLPQTCDSSSGQVQ